MPMQYTYKRFLCILLIVLLAAGCNPFASRQSVGGVAKSLNGGADWQFTNQIKNSKDTSLASFSISMLQFSPTNHEVVFAGAYNSGMFASTDSGANWVQILSKISVFDFAINPFDSHVIYAAGSVAGRGTVLVTKDEGKSWEEIYSDPATDTTIRSIVLDPLHPTTVYIGNASGAVIKSVDAGIHWQLIYNFSDRLQRLRFVDDSLYAILQTKGLFRSSDAGLHFTELTKTLPHTSPGIIADDTANAVVQSFSQFAISTNNTRLIYITTNAGLYRTTDDGSSWKQVVLPIRMGVTVRAVSFQPNTDAIVYTSAGATILKSLDGGITWQTQTLKTDGFVNYILVDQQLPQIVYAGIYTGI